MDCRNCFCEKTERQLHISEQEAKKIFIQSRENLGRQVSNHNINKGKEERKSLKRSLFASNVWLPDSRVSISYNLPEIEKSIYEPRPVSQNFQAHENKIQLQKYRNHRTFVNEGLFNNGFIATNELHQPPKQTLAINAAFVDQKNRYARNRKASATYQFEGRPINQAQYQLGISQQQNQAKSMAFLNYTQIKNGPNQSLTTSQQFKQDLQKILIQKKSCQPVNRNQSGGQQRKKSVFLTPNEASAQIMSNKLSRSPSGVRNIEDLACTKTQSVGSSSDSSEFSQIIFHQMPTEPNSVKKMTNSSINFVQDYGDFSAIQMPQNAAGQGKKEVFNK